MKKILIVDDDYMARSKIRSLLDWERNGYRIAGEVSNGKEALDFMEQELPFIILIDMDMPVMNGVDLIREINKREYPVSVIVLSSYNDFDYVRESMKLGALDYILKSGLDAAGMLTALSGAEDVRPFKEEESLTVKDMEYIRDLYVRKILLNPPTEENTQWIDKYNLRVGLARNMLAIVEIDDYRIALEELDEKGSHTFQQFIENLFKEAAQKTKGMTAVKMRENQFCLILSCNGGLSIGTAQQQLDAVISEVRRNLMRFLNMTASASMGTICLSLGEMSDCYKKAEEQLKQKFYLGKGQMIYGCRIKENRNEESEQKISEKIRCLFSVADEYEMERQVQFIFRLMAESGMSEKKARHLVAEILSTADAEMKRRGIDLGAACGTPEPFAKLVRYETLKDLEMWILEICRAFCKFVKEGTENRNYSRLTINAIIYLSEHYHETISLSDTALYLNVSSGHLSRVFKNDTGMNFVNYLNQFRIGKAREIIAENKFVQMKNIAIETGFNNYNHFFSTFKSVVGVNIHKE